MARYARSRAVEYIGGFAGLIFCHSASDLLTCERTNDPATPNTQSPLPAGVSVVIPVYNSAAGLQQLVDELGKVLTELGGDFEVVLVNDGSKDDSWQVLQALSSGRQWVRIINLMRNYGQHNALLCGIRQARYDVTVTMDDDGQNPPSEIPKLLAHLQQGHDVVYGCPVHRAQDPWRTLGSWLVRWSLRLAMGYKNAKDVNSFRALRTSLRGAFETFKSPSVSIDVLLSWGTVRFSSVTVEHAPRRLGQSNYSLRKLVNLAFTMLTGFSTLPLQLASWIGFGLTLFGIMAFAYVIFCYFRYDGTVPGFAFLASVISIFSGAQLFALGVIGEYLARMHWRLMDRPAYAIREMHSKHDDE